MKRHVEWRATKERKEVAIRGAWKVGKMEMCPKTLRYIYPHTHAIRHGSGNWSKTVWSLRLRQ